MKFLYLSQADVEGLGVTMSEIIDALELAFIEKGEDRVEMPPKPGIHPGDGDNFIHAMPAYIPAAKSAGVKWVSGFPGNQAKGLPYITGLLIFNDVETGIPLAVMDCVWITAMRTAAASAIAARRLARPESSKLGVLGCGVQGHTNTEALNVLFPLDAVVAYDPDQAAANRYRENISSRFGLKVELADDPIQAVSGCDLIVTAGPILHKPHATIKAGWMDEGAFASLVDFDSYWDGQALQEVDKFCTDDITQLEYYRSAGYFQNIPSIHADLGELVTGKKPGRETENERTIACNLGLALDDMAVAPIIYERAQKQGAGTWLDL